MNSVDRLLQRWRFRVARRCLTPGARVLDVGSHEGELLAWLGPAIAPSTGIDVHLPGDQLQGAHKIFAGEYPTRRPDDGPFDAATLLAVVEHLTEPALAAVASALAVDVKSGGRVVVTAPAPIVDVLLAVLVRLRILDGMDHEAHHGFKVDELPRLWRSAGLELVKRRRFQCGLNNLLVFEVKSGTS